MALITIAEADAMIANPTFAHRVEFLAVRIALKVSDEVLDAVHPNVTAKRSNLALSWISDRGAGFVGNLVRNVALDATTVQAATILTDDAVLTNKIKDVFNAMAGITPADKA